MYDFYLVETTKPRTMVQLQLQDPLVSAVQHLQKPVPYGSLQHPLTHRTLHIHFFYIKATPQLMETIHSLLHSKTFQWVTVEEAKVLPKPVPIDTFFREKL